MNDTGTIIKKFEERQDDVVPYEPKNFNQESNSLLATIERLASNPDVDVEKFKALVKINEDAMDRSAKQAYNSAMVDAQGKMTSVLKNRKNDQTNSRYADLDAVLKTVKPIYTKAGFAIAFHERHGTPDNPIPERHIRIIADVMHRNGHTEIMEADMPLDDSGIKGAVNKTGTHAKGSSFSYGRRYMVCMIFNISTGDDDDGNAAGGKVVEYITEDMQTEISDLLGPGDEDKLLKWVKADSIDKIELHWYEAIIASLKKVKK